MALLAVEAHGIPSRGAWIEEVDYKTRWSSICYGVTSCGIA